MNKTQAQNLLRAAQAVREHPRPSKFMMQGYHTCGTPHCVLGCYAFRVDLNKGAFVLVGDTQINPVYYEKKSLKHFGISNGEAIELFSSDGCGSANTPEEAAQYIENFVRAKGFGCLIDPVDPVVTLGSMKDDDLLPVDYSDVLRPVSLEPSGA